MWTTHFIIAPINILTIEFNNWTYSIFKHVNFLIFHKVIKIPRKIFDVLPENHRYASDIRQWLHMKYAEQHFLNYVVLADLRRVVARQVSFRNRFWIFSPRAAIVSSKCCVEQEYNFIRILSKYYIFCSKFWQLGLKN